MRSMRSVLPFVFVSLSFPCMASPALEVKLSTAPSPTESVVHVSAKNVGDKVVFLLRPHTTFGLAEGRLQGAWFDVSDATGKRVGYQGRQVLIRDPGSDSFLQLVPGESIDADIDLAREYDLPGSGHVSVQMRLIAYLGLPSQSGVGETQLAPYFDVRSESIEVSVPVGTSPSAVAPTADNVVPCTADQTEQTAKAFYKGANTSSIRDALLQLSYYDDPIDPAFPEKPPRKHMTADFNYVYWLGEWDDAAPQAPDPAAESTDNVRIDRVVSAVA